MSEPITQEVRELARKKAVEHYDRVYLSHADGTAQCELSLHDIGKARTRVRMLCGYFGLDLARKRCLDVGSGLGYYTDALNCEVGEPGLVIGLDASAGATRAARGRFPDVSFHTGFFPDALAEADFFDLIFAMDLSLINTFDANKIDRDFVRPAMDLLHPGGMLVVGWHTDFSGDYREGWCHWSPEHFHAIADTCGLSEPAMVQARFPVLIRAAIRLCRSLRKSAPVFMIRKK